MFKKLDKVPRLTEGSLWILWLIHAIVVSPADMGHPAIGQNRPLVRFSQVIGPLNLRISAC